MHPTVLAVISPIPAVIMLFTAGLVGFCVWKIRATMQVAARAQREREMALVASLPGAPAMVLSGGLAPAVVVPDEVPTLDALVLPSHADQAADVVAAVAPPRLEEVPSVLVVKAVAELRAGAQRILDAGTNESEMAAADVMIAVATGPAVTALALRAGTPALN